MKKYPKIGIRPTIDGRQGGVRESLEERQCENPVTRAKLFIFKEVKLCIKYDICPAFVV